MSFSLAMAEINCTNCVAACCRAGMSIEMSKKERAEHEGFMKTRTTVEPQPYGRMMPTRSPSTQQMTIGIVNPFHGFYLLMEDCGRLDGNLCSVYTDRPKACRAFEMGGPGCLAARKKAGLVDD